LTNTDPRKTDLFAKFNWPRVSNPAIDFSLPESEREGDVIEREKKTEAEIRKFIDERGTDIAAIIIEPIQGEGGDNHFRGEWLQKLREICDESDILLIFDEVQTGLCTTGRTWCCQHFNVQPDLLAFGKKVQVCGVMAGPRLDDVWGKLFDSGLLVLKSGERSIRFRPALDITKKVIDEALEILRKYCRSK